MSNEKFTELYLMLKEDDRANLNRMIHALHDGDYETVYRCWCESLDRYGADDMPDSVREDIYVKRYLAEHGMN